MIKVIMMCGICGSGKTTYAKQKEKEGYVRLSIDEEMWKIYGRKGIDYPNEQYEKLSEIVENGTPEGTPVSHSTRKICSP